MYALVIFAKTNNPKNLSSLGICFLFNIGVCWPTVAAAVLFISFWLWLVLFDFHGLCLLCLLFLKPRLKELPFCELWPHKREKDQDRCRKLARPFKVSVQMCYIPHIFKFPWPKHTKNQSRKLMRQRGITQHITMDIGVKSFYSEESKY